MSKEANGSMWALVGQKSERIFFEGEDGRAHIYWNRKDARTAFSERDWSGFGELPKVVQFQFNGELK